MKLYYSPGACSLSPHIVALEAGLDVKLEKVDLGTKKLASGGDFFAVNPKGYVPTLELDNGEILTEGPAVVQYLADQKPRSGLAPEWGSPARYRLQEWLTFIGTELHKSFRPLFMPGAPDALKQNALDTLKSRFPVADKALAGKQFLLGDTFTVADAYLFTVLTWARYLKLDMTPYPNLTAYFERVAARPKVQQALKEEGLLQKA